MNLEQKIDFFTSFSNDNLLNWKELKQSGSARQNSLVQTQKQSYILTFNRDLRENESFIYFSELFVSLGLHAPKIYKISEQRDCYLQEYLGENTLYEIIEKEGISTRTEKLIGQSIHELYQFQSKTKNLIDYSKSFDYEEYNHLPISHDLFQFKFLFVDVLEIQYHKSALMEEFSQIIQYIEDLSPKTLMIRDFQSRNIVVNNKDQVFFIDYQAAMYGPALYDVVSLLYQAKANFPEDFRQKFLSQFYSYFTENDQLKLKNSLVPLRLIRNFQVLGAYGLRGLIQKKSHFLQSIELALINLNSVAKQWEMMKNFPELNKIIHTLTEPDFQENLKKQIIS